MTSPFFRALLLLYPRWFRRAYGPELLTTIEDQRTEPCYAGLAGGLRFWREVAGDAVSSALRIRSQRPHSAPARSARASSPAAAVICFRQSQVDVMWQDVRNAIRLFWRRPAFAGAAVLTLGLGIGGTSLIFGLVDALVLTPFSYPEPGRLVGVGVTFPKVNGREGFIEALSPPEYLDIRGARSLRHVIAFDLGNRNISGGDTPERVFTALLFGDPFETLGMRPAVGRGFTREELRPGGPQVAVLSHRIWQTRFGGERSLVGRAIRVNGTPTTVVGVMPPGLLLIGTDLWMPLSADPSEWTRDRRQFSILARVAPGFSRADADAELATIAARTTATYGGQFREYNGWRLRAVPWAEALTQPMRTAARLLLAAVLFVLVIVCASVASLQIARVSTRQRELAVRAALGAGRLRMARELLTESAVLAVAGCLFGLAVAAGGLKLATAFLPGQLISLGIEPSFNLRLLVVGGLVALLSALLVGLLPAIVASRINSQDWLRADARGVSAGAGSQRVRQGLVILELSLALVLLVGAGLMARTLWQLQRVDPGVDTHHVLTMRLTLPREKYEGEGVTRFFQQLVDRLESSPGVTGAAMASQYPPGIFLGTRVRIDGQDSSPGSIPNANVTVVTPNLFRVLGIPLRAGRVLAPSDRAQTTPVAVVNESFVRRYLPGANPVGRRIATGTAAEPQWMEIVGVVGDTRGRGLAFDPEPEVYMPMDQDKGAWNQLFLLTRTVGEPSLALPSIRRVVSGLDPDQPIYAIQTLKEAFAASILQQRASLLLLGVFAALAVILSAIGIYAVVSYAVTTRTQEIGIRMALGANQGDVVRLVVRQVLRLLSMGVVLGLLGGVAVGRLASTLLVGTRPEDPVTLGLVTLLLAGVGLLAGYLPARRASRIDPSVALRVN
jgi:putative ABC transport system permease protein